MSEKEFNDVLKTLNSSRESRLNAAKLVRKNMNLFPHLMEVLLKVNDKISCHAAWVLECVCSDYIYAIIPHLDAFTKTIHKVHLQSGVRSVSKVCELIAKAYYSKDNDTFKRLLTPQHKKRIVAVCFNWLLKKHKVAPKVFAMETLFLFGQENTWIHEDLKHILHEDFKVQSPAFKSRANHIFIRMKKTSIASVSKSKKS